MARMSRGMMHVTDATNASRTLLFDIHRGEWSAELCELFGVPIDALPEVVPSYGDIGQTDPTAFLGLDIPIAGVAGDQQAALVGQAGFGVGDAKCTYGTGSFLLANTGSNAVFSTGGLLTTVALGHPDGSLSYALEGSVFVSGAAVQWLRDGLEIISNAEESEALAQSVPDADGVVFVPALTGLGAPYWDPYARGAIVGLTRGTNRGHIARAALESIAFQSAEVLNAMQQDAGKPLIELRVDGGGSVNNLLMQVQADLLGVPVLRPTVTETTALGAAYLAGLGAGIWQSQTELAACWQVEHRFEPGKSGGWAAEAMSGWRRAVDRSLRWAD
jgi:glycerol kinase